MKNIAAKHRKRLRRIKEQEKQQRDIVQSATPGVLRPSNVTQSRDDVVVEGPALDIPAKKTFYAEDVIADDSLPILSLGSGMKLMSKTTINFTEVLAKDLLDPTKYVPFSPDRAFSIDWSNYLLTAMRQGTFRWEQVQLIVCSLEE